MFAWVTASRFARAGARCTGQTHSPFHRWYGRRMVSGVDRKSVAATGKPIGLDGSRASVPELHKIRGIKQRGTCTCSITVFVKRRYYIKLVDPTFFLIVHFSPRNRPQPVTALVLPPLSGPKAFLLMLFQIASQYISMIEDIPGGVCAPSHTDVEDLTRRRSLA